MQDHDQIAFEFEGGPAVRPLRSPSNTTAFIDNMSLPVHRWFRYSAGFSAEWVQKVVRDHGAATVLDPFAGSGTTLLAAESEGSESIGVDVHPFVARVAQAKLLWRLDPAMLLERAAQAVSTANALDRERYRATNSSTSASKPRISTG